MLTNKHLLDDWPDMRPSCKRAIFAHDLRKRIKRFLLVLYLIRPNRLTRLFSTFLTLRLVVSHYIAKLVTTYQVRSTVVVSADVVMEALVEKYKKNSQDAYEKSWEKRYDSQLVLLKSERKFCGDPVLRGLQFDDSFFDSRNGATFIVRPPQDVTRLFQGLQRQIQEIFNRHNLPNALWISEPEKFHMSLLEVAAKEPEDCVTALVKAMKPMLPAIFHSVKCGIRLGKPRLSFDRTAFAVSWIPIDNLESPEPCYNHLQLRNDLFKACKQAGFPPAMRYANLSAHCTIIRFTHDINDVPPALIDELSGLNCQIPGVEWNIEPGDIRLIYGPCWYGAGTELQI